MTKYFLESARFDGIFFFGPFVFMAVFTVMLHAFFPELLAGGTENLWWFVILVLFLDVGHVYGSLYRSYFNLEEFSKRKILYIFVPIATVFLAAVLVWYDPTVRTLLVLLAWIAAWHFIRQQVGFALLYGSRDQSHSKDEARVSRGFDKVIVWSVTGFPLLYWMTRQSTMNFSWFIENEFPNLPPEIFPSLWNIF